MVFSNITSLARTIYLEPFYWQVAGAFGWPGTETTFESKTNAPDVNAPASNLPHEVAPVVIVISAEARILPWNSEVVPSVADVAACQKTLEALAPFTRRIRVCAPGEGAPAAVPTVLDDWKMKRASALP